MSSAGPQSIAEIALGTDPGANKELYDGWAQKYTADVDNWGYDAPARVAALLKEHLGDTGCAEVEVLDAGCGDGLTGKYLAEAGFAAVDGVDLSTDMLEVAKGRGCYRSLAECDMSQPLSAVADGAYGATSCVGTLTYIPPASGVLSEFARVTKPGGLVCFTHRTDRIDEWRERQDGMVEDGTWELVVETPPLPYLPNHPEYTDKVQMKVCVYKVLVAE
jgi:predicted TPR repeat methyltransferase